LDVFVRIIFSRLSGFVWIVGGLAPEGQLWPAKVMLSAWWRKRCRIAVATTMYLGSLPQPSRGPFEVIIVDMVSYRYRTG